MRTNVYIYPYACHENDRGLCEMEFRSLFRHTPKDEQYMETDVMIAPDRSPFISLRLDVMFRETSLESIVNKIREYQVQPAGTFKVTYIKNGDKLTYDDQRTVERTLGACILGKADMKQPSVKYGVMLSRGHWSFGTCVEAESVWLQHKHKPQNYSTGLTSAAARALVNIAVPDPTGITSIDPCCGMGNVLIEALSMGIDMKGMDINPLAIRGARINLQHFGYDAEAVRIGDMKQIREYYDAAILDMPYALCSILPQEERLAMLTSLRRFSSRSVIISSQLLEHDLAKAGLRVADACHYTKGAFVRNVWLCESCG